MALRGNIALASVHVQRIFPEGRIAVLTGPKMLLILVQS